VVVLDNCHNLFLRRVGGFEAWDCFVRIVDQTCDNTFWLIAMNQASWDYLYNAAGQVPYFRRVVRIEPWGERWIQRLLLLRMRRAGYAVSFSDLVITQLPDLDLSAQAGRTAGGYFRMLWDFTAGNPQLASHFWLDSLVPSTDREDEVRVHLFAQPDMASLERLPADTAFVLTAVAEHENIDLAETVRTTRLSRDFCALALNACLEDGYLERVAGTRVRLSARWQRPIVRFLKRKHLLHESS
jgi:hypothetical protein